MKGIFFKLICMVFWNVAVGLEIRNETVDDNLRYAFYFPSKLRSGLPARTCLTMSESYLPATLTVDFTYRTEESVFSISKAYSCFQINVPKFESWMIRTTLFTKLSSKKNQITLRDQKSFAVQIPENVTFIETDRAYYKMGDLVRIRVVILGPDLKPVTKYQIPSIQILNPFNTKVVSWENRVMVEMGLAQFEFQLAPETETGTWTIVIGHNRKTFNVKEYILPRFKVKIVAPKQIYKQSEEVKVSVCAEYSYGKPVIGRALLKLTGTSTPGYYSGYPAYSIGYPSGSRYGNRDDSSLNNTKVNELSNGCADFTVTRQEIHLASDWIVHLNASVTEIDTDQVEVEYKAIEVKEKPFTLSLHRKYYKPGLPYFGRINIENIHVSSIAGEIFEVCYISETYLDAVCANSTASEQDTVEFVLPAFIEDVGYLEINVRSINYPDAEMYEPLSQWHSNSKNFIQIQRLVDTHEPQCGSLSKFRVLYTSKDMKVNDNVTFYYMVISQQGILELEEIVSTVEKNQLKLEEYSNFLVNTTDYLNINKSVDQFELSIMLTDKMYKDTKLVVYHVYNNEIIADEIDIGSHCYRKIEASWFKGTVYPGVRATLTIKAYKNSLCAISSVDKATEFMGIRSSLDIGSILSAIGPTPTESQNTDELNCVIPEDEERGHTSGYPFDPFPGGPIGPSPSAVYPGSISGGPSYPFDPLHGGGIGPSPSPAYPEPVPGGPGYHSPDFPEYSLRLSSFMQPGYPPGYNSLSSGYPGHYPYYPPHNPHQWKAPEEFDSHDLLKGTGLAVITNLEFLTKSCIKTYTPSGPTMAGYPAYPGAYEPLPEPLSHSAPVSQMGVPGSAGLAQPGPPAYHPGHPPQENPLDRDFIVRSFFPETWLWEIIPSRMPITKVERELPHSITTWATNVLCMSTEEGLGVSDTQEITAFKPFFVDVLLPYSIKRNVEILQLPVKVFNYLNVNLSVSVALSESPGLVLEDIEKGNNQIISVTPQNSVTYYYRLKATKVGKINITVQAFPLNLEQGDQLLYKDIVQKQILVEPEGYRQDDVASVLLCGDDQSNEIHWNMAIPNNAISDTFIGKIKITTEVLGPTIQNLENVLTAPSGCGEQIMAKLTPNLYVLKYLTANGNLKDEVKRRIIANLEIGYQRILSYRHFDGSFSAFGRSDSGGSMYLTTFVFRILGQMKEYIPVDEEILRSAWSWITQHQLANGCFNMGYHIFHYMGVGGVQNQMSTLTAYVLISALEAKLDLKKDALFKARICLLRDSSDDEYSLAIKAYAFSLMYANKKASSLLAKLMETSKTRGNTRWWTGSASPSVNIQTSSYVVMALLQNGSPESLDVAAHIVHWLQTKMNPQGGFYTTVDTVTALDAITRFTNFVGKGKQNLNLSLKINDHKERMKVSDNQERKIEEIIVDAVPSAIEAKVVGTGCVTLQSILTYYIEEIPASDKFKLDIGVKSTNKENSCSFVEIKPCVSYTSFGQSNMVLIEVSMPSGYISNQMSLYELQHNRIIKKFEQLGDVIVFYLAKLDKNEICVPFRIEENVVVENLAKGKVKLYDYYKPEIAVSKSFKITNCDRS